MIVIWDRARVFSDGDIRDVRLEVKGRACSTRETTKTKIVTVKAMNMYIDNTGLIGEEQQKTLELAEQILYHLLKDLNMY